MRNFTLRLSLISVALVVCALSLGAISQASARAPQNDGVKRIAIEELSKLLKGKNKVFVVDVRDADSFKAGHIKGAVNIPYGDVENRLGEFPKNRLIVTYCS